MTAKKPARKQPAAHRKTAKKRSAALAIDGSEIDRILDLVGAPPPSASPQLAALEQQIGAAAPGELRRWFARAFDLAPPADASFAGALPDVPAWLAQLASPPQGTLLAIHQLVGAWPLGVKQERGAPVWLFAGLERYDELDTGGVLCFDGHEMGGCFPGSLSGFLRHELAERWKAVAGADDGEAPDLRDTLTLAPPDPRRRPPAAGPLPAPAVEAWSARARAVATRFEHVATLLALLRGEPVPVADLPGEADWQDDRPAMATSHPVAMFWLLAHWLFDNREELADAVALTADHPSPLVAALRAHVASHDASASHGAQQAALFAAVREAAAR